MSTAETEELKLQFSSIIESIKKNNKISMTDFLSFKDLNICKCKREEIHVNPVIFIREITEKPYESGFRKKRKNYNNHNHRDGHSNFNKRGNRHSNYHDRHHGGHKGDAPFRNPISEATKEMKDQANKWKGHLETVDKTSVLKRAKGLLNKITPDNMIKLRDEIKEIDDECTDKERTEFIKIIFRKATFEDKYVGMYTKLIKYIGEHESKK